MVKRKRSKNKFFSTGKLRAEKRKRKLNTYANWMGRLQKRRGIWKVWHGVSYSSFTWPTLRFVHRSY
jgi:hypothetical protein